MGRQPCCDKIGLKRGPWTIDEDQKLMNFILNNGIHCWRLVPKLAGLMRCGKSCRLRWTNYLRPDLKRGALTEMEENQIIQLHSRLGNRWSKIASHFPGRTDNEIKNHWNTRIKKRLKLLGVDPLTHEPVETSENCEQKDDQILPTDSRKNENEIETKISETTQMGDLAEPQMNKVVPEWELDNTNSLLNNYGQLWEDLREELKQQTNPCSSCSTSFSLEDTAYPYIGEACSITHIEDSELYWSDIIDHAPSWDELHPLDDAFYFGNNQ